MQLLTSKATLVKLGQAYIVVNCYHTIFMMRHLQTFIEVYTIGFPGQFRKNIVQIHLESGQFEANYLSAVVPMVRIRFQTLKFVFIPGIFMFNASYFEVMLFGLSDHSI